MLDDRLKTAFFYLKTGCRIVDVGTDHAYLPIELIRAGIAVDALATDVNKGPLLRAKKNLETAGLEGKIQTKLTDGLQGVQDFHPDTVLIFGMGGELIVRILDEAPWVKDPNVLLVLQPMSKAPILREYLQKNGFSVVGERLSRVDKIYQTIVARYQGQTQEMSLEELWFGKSEYRKTDPLFDTFLEHEATVLQRTVEGKQQGNTDVSEETKLLHAISKIRKEFANR